MPTKQVMLGNQILHGSTREGEWVTEKITNWYEPPASRGNEEERPLADGDYDAEMFYSKRLPTIDGILFHKGRGDAIQALERLAAKASLSAQALTVTDFGLSRFANVKSLGLDYTPVTTRAIRWQIRLKANDPYKYGEKKSFSAAVGTPFDVYQRGTVPAWPLITVTGSMPNGYEISLGTQLIQVTRAVTSGSPHTIDTRTGILRVNGAVVAGALGITELFRVQPGLPQSVYALAPFTGTGTVKFDVTDTYI